MIILDGRKLALRITSDLKNRLFKIKKKPKLVVIKVGENQVGLKYINKKKKACQELKIGFKLISFDQGAPSHQIIKEIDKLNQNKIVTGIIVQLPLPYEDMRKTVIETISDQKDIDGLKFCLWAQCQNKLTKKDYQKIKFLPSAVLAILNIFKYYRIGLENKKIVIIGQGFLVGRPLKLVLESRGYDVSVADEKTKNLSLLTKKADIIISAVGKPNLIKEPMVKKGVIIIDAGTATQENKLVGDVDYEGIKNKAKAITPVPGGVGPVTIAMLCSNLVQALDIQSKKF